MNILFNTRGARFRRADDFCLKVCIAVTASSTVPRNFITNIIDADLQHHKIKDGHIVTRFPPEPNGYLQIVTLSHARSCVLLSVDGQFVSVV